LDLSSGMLSHNKSVTDEGLFALAEGCPLIEKLNLSWCTEITDEGVKAVAKWLQIANFA